MSIDTRAPQVTTAQLMDWLKITYSVPSGPSYPPSPNDKDFFFNETLEIYAQYDQSISSWVNLGPGAGFEKGNLPTGTDTIELYDTKSGEFAYLFLVHDPGNPPAPLLMTDQGFIVKKDLAVGGNILSGQGAFILGYGWTGSGSPTAYSPPLIELLNSTTQIQGGESFPTGMNNQPGALFNRTDLGILYIWSGSDWVLSEKSFSGYYDTLFLVKNDGYNSANLHVGNLTVDGQLQLPEGGSEYGIVIDDVNLYCSAVDRLKTDGIFEAGCGALLNAVCIGSALYGMIPYPYETIQMNPSHNLRFCFGTNERMVLTNSGRLDLPVPGVNGGLRLGTNANLYWNSDYTFRLQNNLIIDQYLYVGSDTVVGGSLFAGTTEDSHNVSLEWSSGVGHVTSNSGILDLKATTTLKLHSGANIEFRPTGDFMYIVGSKTISPSSNNLGNIGGDGSGGSHYWGSGWFNYLRFKDIDSFDALDDLTLVKNYKTKVVIKEGVEREVVDLSSMSHVKADSPNDFVDTGKLNGFLLGCVKALVLRVEKLEEQLKNGTDKSGEVEND